MNGVLPGPDGEGRRRLEKFLAGLPASPSGIMAAFAALQTAEEAELAALGIHPVSVAHGGIESADAEELICGTLPRPAEQAGHVLRTRGGNDYSTWFFGGPGAEQAAVAFTAAVITVAESWRVVTPTAHPVFRR